jgi:light-regulated signal transduction histidine kinase (bacteriophytochrome)/ActR/RegA family two-component response regulator
MSETTIDLSTCENEPIHIPGSVQPHGVLFVLRGEGLEICQASANAAAVIGHAPEQLLGKPVTSIMYEVGSGGASHIELAPLLARLSETRPLYLFTMGVRGCAKPFDAIAHRSGEFVVLELEPAHVARSMTIPDLYGLVQNAIVRLRETAERSLQQLYEACVDEVRAMSGFDRVMLYRFDADWNGEVVAERRREDLEPFLGLHYPASDIPPQARRLYTKNWLRFIPDRDYVPAPLTPANNPVTGGPLDMSYCVLRSVSPVHIQYLRNMGVGASMSVSILRDGKLWGLIACHHYSPRHVPYDVRTACELLAQLMSPHLAEAEDRDLTAYAARLDEVRRTLVTNLEHSEDLAKALILGTPTLLDFIDAGGAAVIVGDEVTRVGHTPSEEAIRAIAATAHGADDDGLGEVASRNMGCVVFGTADELFATDDLSKLSGSGLNSSVAAGVLAVKLSRHVVTQLLWFRPEQVREVNWAGDPAKSVVKGDAGAPDRLSPRGSFALWKQTVRGRSAPWADAELLAARLLRRDVVALMVRRAEEIAAANVNLKLASSEREKLLESERAARSAAEQLNRVKDEFVATLSHELRTPLNAILGWAQLMARDARLPSDLTDGMSVIERNARVQSQMIEDLLEMSRIITGKLRLDLQDTHLPSVVLAAIETVGIAGGAKGVRIEHMIDPLHGVQTTGDPGRLQQIVWNLLSNAVKFTPKGGKVQVVLERVESHVELSVADTGAGIDPAFLPHVFDRFRQADASAARRHGGLGLGLSIVRSLVELHGGTVRAHSEGLGHGATFVVSLPVRVVNGGSGAEQPRVHPRGSADRRVPDCESLALDGVRVLVVDDEPDARALVKRLLDECRCLVTTTASAAEAMALLRSQPFDVLVSDIGMPGEDGYSLIRQLRASETESAKPKLPALALTAYARTEDRRRALLAGFQNHVSKPVEASELLTIVASLAGRI